MVIQTRFPVKTMFAKFFFACLLLLTLAIAGISIWLFHIFSNSAIRQINELSERTLMQGQNSTEYLMNQAMQVSAQLSFEYPIIQQMNTAVSDPIVENNSLKKLSDIIFINESIYSIGIYNGNNASFLTSDYPNIDNEAIEMLKNSDPKTKIRLVPRKLKLISSKNKEENVYSIFYYNRDKTTNAILNALIVNVKEEAVRKGINPDDRLDQGNILIVDSDGTVISDPTGGEFLKDYSTVGSIQKMLTESGTNSFVDISSSGEKVLVTHSFSQKLGWHFLHVVPYQAAVTSISKLRNTVIWISLILFALSGIAALFVSGKLSSPLRGLVETLEQMKEKSKNNLKVDYLREVLTGVKEPHPSSEHEFSLRVDLYKGTSILILRIDELFDATILEVEEFSEDIHKQMRRSLLNLVYELMHPYYAYESLEINKDVVLLINNDNAFNDKQILAGLLSRLQEQFKQSMDTSVTAAWGTFVNDWANYHASYQAALEAADYRIVYGLGSILTYETVFANFKQEFEYPQQQLKTLLDAIKLGKEELIGGALDDIFNAFKECQFELIKLSVNHLLLTVFITTELSIHDVKDDLLTNFNNAVSKLRKLETLEQMKLWFAPYILHDMQRIKEKRKHLNSDLLERIRSFVEGCYANTELSVELVANRFDYNPMYFGRLFKELFNQSFSEYITELRLNKSKTYLEQDQIAIKEVGIKVGFNNPSYFVTLFKKHTGMSPSEYRNKQKV
ncbi:AraC family transcriptional regulator [Paenibacillus sp. LjRoot153]|uniref:AraC family transcriptional regulator n=1 Tax=Paenibacillus sp. LjRoot153 TaxID=3342270 RepID=UPI003ED068A5